MKKLLLLLFMSASLASSADFTITISIPDAISSEVLSAIDAWRLRQLTADGISTKFSSVDDLGQAILIDTFKRIIDDQCKFDAASCPTSIKTAVEDKAAAEAAIASETDKVAVKK